MTTSDENVETSSAKKNNLDELNFIQRPEDESAKGKAGQYFFCEFNRPLKYQIGQRLHKGLCSCEYCLKSFVTTGAFSRHNDSMEHKIRKKINYMVQEGA